MKGGEVYPGMELDQQFPRARVVRFEETRYSQVQFIEKVGTRACFSRIEVAGSGSRHARPSFRSRIFSYRL
jgi:hypothetical protein